MKLTKKERILKLLRESDVPLTDAEIAKKLRMNPNTARPRRIELERDGVIIAAAMVTQNGRQTIAWRAATVTDAGAYL